MKDGEWRISVIRDDLTTAIDQMTNAADGKWELKMKVMFLGEHGLDAGGLFREMMTLLFR